MTTKLKICSTEITVADAVANGLSDLETLRDELQEWYDNLPESFQNGSKGDTLQEAIDALSEVDCLPAPDCIGMNHDDESEPGEIGGTRFTYVAYRKRKMSRSLRRDEATAQLRGALDAMRDELEKAGNDEGQPDSYLKTRDEIEAFCDELENLIDSAESVEFPGMYG